MKREPTSAGERSGTQYLKQQRQEINAINAGRAAPHLVDAALEQEQRGVVRVPVAGVITMAAARLLEAGALTLPHESGCCTRSQ